MRRLILTFLLIVACFSWGVAQAQPYPDRPIRMIVPTPAGGPIDTMARLLGNALAAPLGQPLVIDNRGGAGNTLGSRDAAHAEADGYTLLFSSASGLVISPMLYKSIDYDPVTSFAPIALVSDSPILLVVNPNVPAHSVAELVAYAKANLGKVNFSSGGVGTIPHLTGELFKAKAGINVVHVPYRGGGPSIADVVGGQIQFTFEGMNVLLPLVRDGKLRALAITAATRNAQLPDVPTMVESGFPDVIASSWTGLLAPAATPLAIITKLNAATNKALLSDDMKAALTKVVAEPLGGSPQDLAARITEDRQRWGAIIRQAGINLD
jgi:tripartite-type tricarboxylate transporter receptor subunit TctC